MKRAFKHSMLLHATLYFLLLMGSGYVLVRAPPSLPLIFVRQLPQQHWH